MKVKKIVLVNSIIVFIFFILNILHLLIEKSIKESTSELLAISLLLIFFLVLMFFNKTSFFNFEQKIKKYFAKFSIVALTFIIYCISIYFMNWYVFYPILNS